MRSPALILALTCLAGAAAARPLERELPPTRAACWERQYDAAHLAAHPRQKVTKIRLVHLPQNWQPTPGGAFYVQLYVNLRLRTTGHAFDYQIGGLCRPHANGLACTPEWDAGTWRIEPGPGGTLRIRNGGITANPNPYDAEEIADGAVKIGARPDDTAWLLSPAAGACTL